MLWRGKQKFTHIESVGFNSGFGDFMMPPGVVAHPKRYFVDPTNGNNSNDGRSWFTAFETFEKGIDLCRFDHGTTDVADDKAHRAFLFLAPGHYNETTQLLFSGYNISVIGCGIPVPGKDYGVSLNYDGTASSTAAMLINGSGIELANLHLYCDAAIPALYIYFPGDNNYVHDLVIEADGTNCTYGIYATSMKGSWIERCTIDQCATAGIGVHYDAADQYAIDGGIKDCHIASNVSNTSGITVHANLVCRNFWVEHNFVGLTNGSSCKGIDVNSTSGVYVVDNYVSVPSSATPIEHAGGEQFWMGNHTAAGTTNADPAPAAGA